MSGRGGWRRFIATSAVIAATLSLSACRVDIAATVNVADSGGGTVSVVVTADADAVRSAPELVSSLNVDDLRAAGWDVSVQDPTPDGGVAVTASRDFATPDEGTALLAQLSGENGPLRDLSLRRDGGLSESTHRFTGTGGLPQGLAGFADDEALSLLGGAPFAESLAASGVPLAEALGISLRVTLPGTSLESTSATVTGDDDFSTTFEWVVPVDGADVALAASTRDRNVSALVASIVANAFLVLIVALALALGVYVVSVVRRRSRSTPAS